MFFAMSLFTLIDMFVIFFFFFSSRRRHTRLTCDWSSDVCSSDLMESGAILVYLAGRTGKFLPRTPRGKYDALQWLMFQMGGVGPTFGQAHHFMRAKKDEIPYGSERYGKEAKRLYAVMDRHLRKNEYFSEEYSIADIAIYPWVARHEWHRVDLADYPNVKGWYEGIGARPAVARGMAVPPLN